MYIYIYWFDFCSSKELWQIMFKFKIILHQAPYPLWGLSYEVSRVRGLACLKDGRWCRRASLLRYNVKVGWLWWSKRRTRVSTENDFWIHLLRVRMAIEKKQKYEQAVWFLIGSDTNVSRKEIKFGIFAVGIRREIIIERTALYSSCYRRQNDECNVMLWNKRTVK